MGIRPCSCVVVATRSPEAERRAQEATTASGASLQLLQFPFRRECTLPFALWREARGCRLCWQLLCLWLTPVPDRYRHRYRAYTTRDRR